MTKWDYLAMFGLAAVLVILSVCSMLDNFRMKKLEKRIKALEDKEKGVPVLRGLLS